MARKCVHDREARRCSQCEPQQAFEFYRKQAIERHLEFKITYQQFLDVTAQVCHFCGRYNTPRGLDRKNNDQGYVIWNLLPACWPCNRLKAGSGYLEFLDHIQMIARYQDNLKRRRFEEKQNGTIQSGSGAETKAEAAQANTNC